MLDGLGSANEEEKMTNGTTNGDNSFLPFMRFMLVFCFFAVISVLVLFSSIVVTALEATDLSVGKVTVSEAVQIPAGSFILHNISVANTGKGTAFNVTVKEVYPDDVSFVSSSIAPVNGDNVFFVGNINEGDSFVFTITVLVKKAGSQEKFINNSVRATFLSKKGVDDSPKIALAVSAIFIPEFEKEGAVLSAPKEFIPKDSVLEEKSFSSGVVSEEISGLKKKEKVLPGKGGEPILRSLFVSRPEIACGVSRNAGKIAFVPARSQFSVP
ncbi:MAG: hypothetical protein Q7K43_05475, partial [Candidatus Woesearchaeota archaeon]|nr:hypothetical protein [Candidatus Woesearchaeota archaeon]